MEGSRFRMYPTISQFLSSARKAKNDVKQAAPANYRARCFAHGSVGRYSFAWRATDPTRLETFPGAACLTLYLAFLALRGISRDLLGTFQSGSPPGARATISDRAKTCRTW